MNIPARTLVVDLSVALYSVCHSVLGYNAGLLPPRQPTPATPGARSPFFAPAVAYAGNLGCEVALIAPASAYAGNSGCEVALIAPAVAYTGNSGCEVALIAPAAARADRVGCGWYIPAPEPLVSCGKNQRIIAAINLMVRGQKDQFCTQSRFNTTLGVQAGGYCPRSAYAASIVLFGGQREQ